VREADLILADRQGCAAVQRLREKGLREVLPLPTEKKDLNRHQNPNSYLRDLLAKAVYRLDSYSMTARRHWRHVRALLCALALISSYLYGQDGPANVRAVIRKVQPRYPALAQRMSIKGSVKLEVVVEPDGSVKSLNTKGGHPVLVQAAQDAIRQWKWQSASHETLESVEVRFNPQ
jgi:TonB family protein